MHFASEVPRFVPAFLRAVMSHFPQIYVPKGLLSYCRSPPQVTQRETAEERQGSHQMSHMRPSHQESQKSRLSIATPRPPQQCRYVRGLLWVPWKTMKATQVADFAGLEVVPQGFDDNHI